MPVRIYTGCMWSGKTTRMSRDILAAKEKDAYSNYFHVKPTLDDRDPEDSTFPHYRSRLEKFLPCSLIGDDGLAGLKLYAEDRCLVTVDEAMMFQRGILSLIEHFLVSGKGDLWLSGLDKTSEGKAFGEFGRGLHLAHEVIYLRARCDTEGCVMPATETHYAADKSKDIKVGDAGYSPRCLDCWERLTQSK